MPLLKFENISKTFGANIANNKVSFSIERGTIHALIGENGAGKSTAMKILFGLYQKDSGQIFLNEKPVNLKSPLEAKAHGLGMVHQHFMLAGSMTALDHFFLDEKMENRNFWKSLWPFFKILPRFRLRQEVTALAGKYQMPVPWDEQVQNLSVGFQQRLEILKILRNQAEILILDEPTAVLTPQESEALFIQLRELKHFGKTIIIITHKLKEVMALADEVTVFRQGRVVAHRQISKTNPTALAELMVGRNLTPFPPISPVADEGKNSKALFQVQDLSTRRKTGKNQLQNLSFSIKSGQILGVAGIEGNGQSELIRILLNPKKFKTNLSGNILWNEKSILNQTAQNLRDRGLSFFPEDRLEQAALIRSSMKENFILGLHRSSIFNKMGWLRSAKIHHVTEQEMTNFDVRPVLPDAPFRSFSGGNQQKLIVARELFRKPQLLIAAQPTRGVDIGAIERVHLEILQLRNQGGSVLLISSDLDELLKLSDEIMVFFEGKIVGSLPRSQFDEKILGQWMLSGRLGDPG